LKRFRPRAQGRGFTIRKRTSTITFVVSDDRNYRSNGPAKKGKVVKHAPVVKEVVKEVAAPATETAAPVASTTKKAAAKKAPAKKAPAKKAVAKEGKAE
jgi:hypothetical protein